MPKLEEELKLSRDNDPVTGRYTSKFEQGMYKRTGMSLEQLCRSGRLTNSYGRKAPMPPDDYDEIQKAEFYHTYVKDLMTSGSLMFYETPSDALPKKISFDKQKGMRLSTSYSQLKKVNEPGWFNKWRDKRRLARGEKGTPEMERYRSYTEKLKEAQDAREAYQKQQNEYNQPNNTMKLLKENIDSGLKHYLNYRYDPDVDPVNQFTEDYAREELINELGNLMLMDTVDSLMQTDPAKAKELMTKIQNQHEAKGADGVFSILSDEEKTFVRNNVDHIRNAADLKNFLHNGGRDRLAQQYSDSLKAQKADITKPNLRFHTGFYDEQGEPVVDEECRKCQNSYDMLCSKAREAMNTVKKAAADYPHGMPANVAQTVKEGLAVIVLQSAVAHSMGFEKTKGTGRTILSTLQDRPDPNVEKTNFDQLVENMGNMYLKKLKIPVERMQGKDLNYFLASNTQELISKDVMNKGFAPKPQEQRAQNVPQNVRQQERQQNQPHYEDVILGG